MTKPNGPYNCPKQKVSFKQQATARMMESVREYKDFQVRGIFEHSERVKLESRIAELEKTNREQEEMLNRYRKHIGLISDLYREGTGND